MTKTFQNMAAQGDMLLVRIDALPADAVKAKAEQGEYILAHSETGHHHVVREQDGVEYYQHANDNFIAYLIVSNPVEIEHKRSFDTHEAIKVSPGVYQIRRQREYIHEGYRPALD